jgi:hypothetical protein
MSISGHLRSGYYTCASLATPPIGVLYVSAVNPPRIPDRDGDLPGYFDIKHTMDSHSMHMHMSTRRSVVF